jgi:hypothetical protein
MKKKERFSSAAGVALLTRRRDLIGGGGAEAAILPSESCVEAAAPVRPAEALEEQLQQAQERPLDVQGSGGRHVGEYAHHGDESRGLSGRIKLAVQPLLAQLL